MVIRRDPRTEFLSGATAPARKKARRESVATERYVATEILNDDMELDNSINNIESANRMPAYPTKNYSVRQRQNLSRFEEIPSIVRNYSQFLDYHHQRGGAQREPQAANTRPPVRDEYLESVPRMFEIVPQAAVSNVARLPQRNHIDQMPQEAIFNETSMRDLAVSMGSASVRRQSDEFGPNAGRHLLYQMP